MSKVALFKDGKQITQGYDTPDEIPVQTEHCRGDWGKLEQKLLWPCNPFQSNQDGYEIRVLD